jgi:hypothetical protein
MAKVVDAFKEAGETAGVATAGIIGTSFSTASDLTKGVGKAATSATYVAANTLEGVNKVTENLSDTAAGFTARNKLYQDAETDVYGVKSASNAATEKKRIELDTQRKIDELARKAAEDAIKQKEKMATLDKQKILSDQEQAENDNQLALGYYYGFKSDSSPYEAGSIKSYGYRTDKTWYEYYYPTAFIDDNGDFHEIILPEKNINDGRREKKMKVYDNRDNKDIYIEFVREAGKIYGDLMVPKITDAVTGIKIPIKTLKTAKGYYYILKTGGKKRKTNKKANRRTNKKTNKRRRTIRRR